MSRVNMPSPRAQRRAASDHSLIDNFDAPWIEPVRMRDQADPSQWQTVDVSFARADMDYWEHWANALREKRRIMDLAELQRIPGMDALNRARAIAEINRRDVQIFDVLDQQYTIPGIKKILDDALARGGMSNGEERKRVLKHIGPLRQQELASEIASEPRASIEQLRDAVKQLAAKLGIKAPDAAAMDNQAMIDFCAAYSPPIKESEGEINPTEPGDATPGGPSTSEAATRSSGISLDANPVSSHFADGQS